jgi:hypothetical protein
MPRLTDLRNQCFVDRTKDDSDVLQLHLVTSSSPGASFRRKFHVQTKVTSAKRWPLEQQID